MKCRYCGSEIPDGAASCPNCFAPVENPNPFAHSEAKAEEETFSYHGGPDNTAGTADQGTGQFDPRKVEPSGQRYAPMGYQQNNQPGQEPFGKHGGMPSGQAGPASFGQPGGMPSGQAGPAPFGRQGGMPNGQAGPAPFGQPGNQTGPAPFGQPGNQAGPASFGRQGGMPNQPGAQPPYSHGRKYEETYGGFNPTNVERMNGMNQKKSSKATFAIIGGAAVLVVLLAVIAINAGSRRGAGADAGGLTFGSNGTLTGTDWGDDVDTVASALGNEAEIIGNDEAVYLSDAEGIEGMHEDADVICSFDDGLYDVAVKYDSTDQDEYDQLLDTLEGRFGQASDYILSEEMGWTETVTEDDGDQVTVELLGTNAKAWDLGDCGIFLTRDSADHDIVIMSTKWDN